MKKQVKFCALAAITVVSAASMAQATDINLYGSSAQFNYWAANAPAFVSSKCSSTTVANVTHSMEVSDSYGGSQNVSQGFVQGSTCGSVYGSTLNFRYAGIASAEGYLAINNQLPLFTGTSASLSLQGTCSIAAGQRLMLNTDGSTYGCYPVNVATTDLSVQNINQYVDPSIATLPTFTVPMTGTGALSSVSDVTTIVTPFAFFVNSQVTAGQCFNSTGDNIGFSCSSNADCNPTAGNMAPTGNVCTNTTIDNLSRLQVTQLFQGNVANWNNIGSNFTTLPVTVCLRVPGSGTHATLDKMVLSAGNLGWGTVGSVEFPTVNNTDTTNPPLVTYVESTAGMKVCLANPGAVGYMDSDNPTVAGTYNRVKYNGNSASRQNLLNGLYDFYAVSHIYYAPANASIVTPLTSFISTSGPTNISNLGSGRSFFYAAISEMQVLRSDDLKYPQWQGAWTITDAN
jgi:ABC-type phosphate transport system substrate-binding protein